MIGGLIHVEPASHDVSSSPDKVLNVGSKPLSPYLTTLLHTPHKSRSHLSSGAMPSFTEQLPPEVVDLICQWSDGADLLAMRLV